MSQFFTGGGGGPPPPGTVTELDGNVGAATPSGGIINVLGVGTLTDGFSSNGNILTSGSGNTLTIYETQAQYVTNYTLISTSNSPYTALATDYYISVDATSGPVTIYVPSALTLQRMFLIKDKFGQAFTNNITITTSVGTTLFDGATTYVLDTEYEAVLLTFDGTSAYEAF
jgi:hypothetical protein